MLFLFSLRIVCFLDLVTKQLTLNFFLSQVMMQRDVVNASELRPLFLAERNTRDLTDMVDEYGDFPLRDYGAQLMPEVSNMIIYMII